MWMCVFVCVWCGLSLAKCHETKEKDVYENEEDDFVVVAKIIQLMMMIAIRVAREWINYTEQERICFLIINSCVVGWSFRWVLWCVLYAYLAGCVCVCYWTFQHTNTTINTCDTNARVEVESSDLLREESDMTWQGRARRTAMMVFVFERTYVCVHLYVIHGPHIPSNEHLANTHTHTFKT